MILLGAAANAATVAVGGFVGLFAGKLLPERLQKSLISALALVVIGIALPGIDDSQKPLVPILSMVLGVLMGELLDLDKAVNRLGDWLKKRIGGQGKFTEGFVCGTMVCLAVWMAFCARSAGGKMVSLFGPIFLFVLCGFEHSVANMYYIPAGIFLAGNGELSWLDLLRNLLPVTLGNLVGGCALGGILYLLYARKAG